MGTRRAAEPEPGDTEQAPRASPGGVRLSQKAKAPVLTSRRSWAEGRQAEAALLLATVHPPCSQAPRPLWHSSLARERSENGDSAQAEELRFTPSCSPLYKEPSSWARAEFSAQLDT